MSETKPCIRCREDRQFALSRGKAMPACDRCGGTGQVPSFPMPTGFMDALLTLCSHGLPARLLLDVMVSQHVPEDLASTAIRTGMSRGSVKLGANMNIVRAL